MPLSRLTCPVCLAELKPKTPVPEGTRVRCPKCKGAFFAGGEPPPVEPEPEPVQEPMPDAAPPAEEEIAEAVEVVEEAPPPPRRTRRRRDDDEEDERPRRKPAAKGGIPLWVWLVSGGVGLVSLRGCCGIGTIVGYSLLSGMSVDLDHCKKIQHGMTVAQVEAIMGPPTEESPDGVVKTWVHGTYFITVTFQDGKVRTKACNVPGSTGMEQ
jgi:hypothetical protein